MALPTPWLEGPERCKPGLKTIYTDTVIQDPENVKRTMQDSYKLFLTLYGKKTFIHMVPLWMLKNTGVLTRGSSTARDCVR
jgi:hypothetical protein